MATLATGGSTARRLRAGVLASITAALAGSGLAVVVEAQMGTAFTYQGRLTEGTTAPTGAYDLRFTLHTANTGDTQVGPTLTLEDVPVAEGVFTVALDFGTGVFTGPRRWLQVEVRPGASTGGFTLLTPRQELTPTPHALVAGQALAVPAGTITSTMIAPGAVGLAQINQAQVQARVTGTCPVGQYFRGIAANGTVVCEPVPGVPTITSVDTGGDVGRYTSIAIGADGLPVISYYDGTNGTLKVAKCGNAACSSGNTLTTVDATSNVGWYSSIAVGTDGLPVISYYDLDNGALKVAKCGNGACSSGNTVVTVDATGSVGWFSSIAVGTDGQPVISYWDGNNGDLKVLKCGNAACSTGNTVAIVDAAGNVGEYTSIALGADGRPVISYYDATNGDLKVARCGNAACSSGNTLTSVDAAGAVGWHTSIALRADGRPVISYYNVTSGTLKLVTCGNVDCSGSPTLTTVDATGTVGQYTSVALSDDGRPVISYYDTTNGALKVARCGNAACSSGTTLTTADTAPQVGLFTSLALGADGLPIISYYDFTNGDLKVLKCGTRSCQ